MVADKSTRSSASGPSRKLPTYRKITDPRLGTISPKFSDGARASMTGRRRSYRARNRQRLAAHARRGPPGYLEITGGPKLWTIEIVVVVAPARPQLSAACPAGVNSLHRQTDGDVYAFRPRGGSISASESPTVLRASYSAFIHIAAMIDPCRLGARAATWLGSAHLRRRRVLSRRPSSSRFVGGLLPRACG
jgi:hypothetical protein